MPELREGALSPSPERKISLRDARLNTGRYLEDIRRGIEPRVSDSEFLFSFGLLVRKKSKLGRLAAEVDTIAGSLISQAKDPDPAVSGNALIPNFLKGALTGVLKQQQHHHQLTQEAFENYSAAASALEMGGEDNPEIQSLLDQCREGLYKPDSAERRRFLGRALRLGGGVALVAVGGTTAVVGMALQTPEGGKSNLTETPEPPRPKPPTFLSKEPSPTTASSPIPEASPSPTASLVASPEPSPSPTSQPTVEPTATATAVPKRDETAERMVEIGNKNYLQLYFEEEVKRYQERAETEAARDPSYAERVPEQARKSNKITLVLSGIDETREEGRMDGFSHGQGWGRSDIIKIVVIDPATQKIDIINISRDLFSPEVWAENINFGNDPRWDKVNAGTMISFVREAGPDPKSGFRQVPGFKPGKLPDSFAFTRKMLETATGLRIDGMMQANIDFIRGSSFYQYNGVDYPPIPGFLDVLFPKGLTITPQETVHQYRAHFEAGKTQTMNALQAMEFARTRGDSEDGRVKRQDQVMFAGLTALAPELLGLFSKDLEGLLKNTLAVGPLKNLFKDSVDRGNLLQIMADGLKEQTEVGNFLQYQPDGTFFDLIEFLGSTSQFIEDMRAHPKGKDILGRIGFNSKDGLWRLFTDRKSVYREHFVNRSGGVAQSHQITTIRLNGSEPFAPPSRYGNYMATWKPLRTLVAQWGILK